MKRKSLAALAMIPFGLFASSASASSETAAATDSVVSYSSQSQSGNTRNGRNQYDDQVQMRGQQPMQQEDQRYGFTVMGDYLYWVPYFSNMPFAQKNNLEYQTTFDASGVLQPGNVTTQNVDMGGDSGFRIAAKYQSDWQTVGFSAAWTRFHTTDTNKTSNDAIEGNYNNNVGYNGAIQGYWNSPEMSSGPYGELPAPNDVMGDVVFQADGKFQIKFDQLDFVFNTLYKPTDWCRVMPGMGLRSLLTTMKLTATQLSNKWGQAKVAEAPFNTAKQVMTQSFDTVGLVAGMGSEFDISDGFKVVSNLALAYTIGTMKETNTSTVAMAFPVGSVADGTDGAKYQRLRSDRTTFKPQVDLDLGLQYEWLNDEKTFGLLLELAYEMHYLPNFVQFIRTDRQTATQVYSNLTGYTFVRNDRAVAEWSDLMFQGLRARVGISF